MDDRGPAAGWVQITGARSRGQGLAVRSYCTALPVYPCPCAHSTHPPPKPGRSSSHSLLILYRCTRNFGSNGCRVFLLNLPYGMDHAEMGDLCSEFGAVVVGPRHTQYIGPRRAPHRIAIADPPL